MAKKGSKTPIVIGIIALAIVGAYIASPESFQNAFNVGSSGVQVTPDRTGEIGEQNYEGSVTINIDHRDALDSAETRTEGTNITTTYYKLVNGVYKAIGSGSGGTVFVTANLDRIFVAESIPSGQNYYVAPASTADPNLNPRIKAFDFFDISGDGTKEYVFTVDVTGLKIVGGQTTPTIDLYVDSYDYSVASLTSPADQSSISTSSGTNVFIEWDLTHVLIESANAQYEYEIKINSTDSAKWDRGQSTLTIPNIGVVALADFVESQDGTNTIYKYTLGFGLNTSNYVTIAQNVQNKTDVDLKLVANFGASENYTVLLTVRTITPSQGSASTNDSVGLTT